jgi:YfiH family protein
MNPAYEYQTPKGKFELYLEKPEFDFFQVHQTHSTILLPVSATEFGLIEADGILASYDKNVLIKTADCMPILILGNKHYLFLHAGWKGLANGILKHALIKEIQPYYAFIGPSICKDSFEVSPEFKSNFKDKQDLFFEKSGKLFFDLQSAAKRDLLAHNSKMEIVDSKICTYYNEKLHSFRREKTKVRNYNIFRPN